MSATKPEGLRVRGLTYRSADFTLGPVDFELRPGELLTVLGANGAGKTTLLRLLAGLDRPSGGSIRLEGRELSSAPARERNVGLVFQDLALFPHLTVRENVAYGLRARRWAEAELDRRVEALLLEFRLVPLADRLPAAVSGGEQQRVALARALAPRPRILLFDEPLSAADRRIRQPLQREIVDRVRREDLVAVYVTHDLEEGLGIADRVAVLHDGRWVREGTVEEVLRDPASRVAAEMLGFNVFRTAVGWRAAVPSAFRPAPPGSEGAMPARVERARADGLLLRLSVSLLEPGPEEQRLEVVLPREEGSPVPRPGDRLALVVRGGPRLPDG